MPLTVITLKKIAPSLRGDLSKWMQEIATGVYIGNFNSRIRDKLWQRVLETVGDGEATLSYASRSELGYSFETYNTNRQVVMSDGISLVLFPRKESQQNEESDIKSGFSKAAQYYRARKFSKSSNNSNSNNIKEKFVVVDIETDGLDPVHNNILEFGAVKYENNELHEINRIIRPFSDYEIPNTITNLTGITNELISSEGTILKESLIKLVDFIGERTVVGYNINFDVQFINNALKTLGLTRLTSKTIDLMPLVKKENMYLDNYKLQTVFSEFGVSGKVEHRALSDAKQIYELAFKLKEFAGLFCKKD